MKGSEDTKDDSVIVGEEYDRSLVVIVVGEKVKCGKGASIIMVAITEVEMRTSTTGLFLHACDLDFEPLYCLYRPYGHLAILVSLTKHANTWHVSEAFISELADGLVWFSTRSAGADCTPIPISIDLGMTYASLDKGLKAEEGELFVGA
ncbi:hypothetical protein Tco_1376629 [Tanacetum coccineum]